MKRIEADLYRVLASGHYSTFLALEVGPWPNGSFTRYTSLPGWYGLVDHFYGRYGEYAPNMPLLSVDTPRSAGTLSSDSFKMTFADPEFSFRPLLESGGVGTPMWLKLGFIDCDSQPDYDRPNVPHNNMFSGSELYLSMLYIYKGSVNRYLYNITEQNEVVLTIEGTSPMASLNLRRDLSTSRFWMRSQHPTDSAFDSIYKGSQQQTLLWGKGPPAKQKKSGGIFGKLFG